MVVTLSPATIPAPPPLAAVNVGPSAEAGSDDGNFGVGLGVDLGPEPPLLKASAPTKAKVKAKAKADAAKPRTSARRPFWLLPALAGAGVLLLAAGAALAYRQFSGPPAKVAATQAGPTKEINPVAVANVVAPRTKPAATRTDPEPQGKQVVVVASDGTRSVEADLKSAIRAAIGSRGHVLLLNREPLKFSAAEALRAAGGVLVIRAGEGVKPVLKVEVKGGAPFLSVRTDASLRIEGVTIEVTYVDPGNDPAAVIEAGGSVTLDRCAFRVVNPTVKSRAVAAESGALTATGCWFENFDRAIDVACFGGAASSLRHCMIVQTSGGDKTPGVSAVRLRSMPGGFSKTGRKLVLERCTIRNGGFLEFVGFAPTAPVSVTLTGNAVVADSLISWEPGTTPIGRESLVWTGRDDAYSVQSTTGWVNLVASKEAAPTPLPDGPKDLASWTKLVGDEIDPILPPLRFATEPSASSERLEPSAFAVTSSRTSRPHGADPAYVGPGATPLTTPAPALAVPPGRFGGR